MDYDEFERGTQILLEAYTAPAPEGYARLSLEQVHRADMELFKYMMRETRQGIKTVSGVQPLAQALKEAIKSPDVRLCLQPLPCGSKRKHEAVEDEIKKKPSKTEEQYQRTIENLQNQLRNLKKSAPSAPAKGRGKGRGKARLIRLPPQLIGMSPTTSSGEPMCYNFNLKGCSLAKAGEKCERGWHLCMRPNCQQAHSQREHPAGQ